MPAIPESPSVDSPADLWQLPLNSWDTHVHVFSPETHPYVPSRAYSPAPASWSQFLKFNNSLTRSASNIVLVQPSPYGIDNSLIMSLLNKQQERHRGTSKTRAILVLDLDSVTKEDLCHMDNLGVRGIRINMEASGLQASVHNLKAEIITTAEAIKGAGLADKWFIQLYIAGQHWDDLGDTIQSLGVRIIADHQGGMKGSSMLSSSSSTLSQPGIETLVSLARSKHVIIKISGLYRSSSLVNNNFSDVEILIKHLASEVSEQLIWGSDWPHTGDGKDRKGRSIEFLETFRKIDNAGILRQLKRWCGVESCDLLMVKNPSKFFD